MSVKEGKLDEDYVCDKEENTVLVEDSDIVRCNNRNVRRCDSSPLPDSVLGFESDLEIKKTFEGNGE
ncbi:hypothetical protein L6452_25833 [Arctium lappa]|uniref:Uncharacterized protein n=1 Tax=Arctium lappa TaxID=4217 RepID=A0ACB9ABK3_ARCLA|nr:hypothetical protein L6452_25833 [Arctium lappa]